MAASAPTAAPYARLEKPPAYRWWILVANMLAYGQFFLTCLLYTSDAADEL